MELTDDTWGVGRRVLDLRRRIRKRVMKLNSEADSVDSSRL